MVQPLNAWGRELMNIDVAPPILVDCTNVAILRGVENQWYGLCMSANVVNMLHIGECNVSFKYYECYTFVPSTHSPLLSNSGSSSQYPHRMFKKSHRGATSLKDGNKFS
jgi:hypothetical protein